MKILSQNTGHTKIETIAILGELAGNDALELQKHLYGYFYTNKHSLLMDLQHIENIDSLGIDVLEKFTRRGMNIGLFNTRGLLEKVVGMLSKDSLVRTYNETNITKAISLFETDISNNVESDIEIANRQHLRIDTFLKMDFKYHPPSYGVISGRASILNISEGGLYADQILAVDKDIEEIIKPKGFSSYELFDMKFKLGESLNLIDTKAVCVREFWDDGKLCAGIRFKNMSHDYMNKINSYIAKIMQNKSN